MEVIPLFEGVNGIKIFLFRHNYIDRKILSVIQQKGTYIEEDGAIILGAPELRSLIQNNFETELNFLRDLPPEALYKNSNSIYFIDRLMSQFTNLGYVSVSVSNSKSYTRLRADSLVTFDFKILQVKIDIARFPIHYIDDFLSELGYMESMNLKNYTFIAPDLADRIDVYCSSEVYDERFEPIVELIEAFLEDKVLSDGAKLILELN